MDFVFKNGWMTNHKSVGAAVRRFLLKYKRKKCYKIKLTRKDWERKYYVKSVRAFGASDEVFLESKSAGFASALEESIIHQ